MNGVITVIQTNRAVLVIRTFYMDFYAEDSYNRPLPLHMAGRYNKTTLGTLTSKGFSDLDSWSGFNHPLLF